MPTELTVPGPSGGRHGLQLGAAGCVMSRLAATSQKEPVEWKHQQPCSLPITVLNKGNCGVTS